MMICSHCGGGFEPFRLPPHDCAGVRADVAEAERRHRVAVAAPKPIAVGDSVEWMEHGSLVLGGTGTKRGTVSRIVGGEVLIRFGNTLVQRNMARLRRVCGAKEGAKP